jgi:hypothetical protein
MTAGRLVPPFVVAAMLVAPTAPAQEAARGGPKKAKHAESRAAAKRPVEPPVREGTPLDIALAYVRAQRAELGLQDGDLDDVAVSSQHTSEHSGVTHVYLTQRYRGIDVHGAQVNINVTRDGKVLGMGSSFVSGLAASVRAAASERGAVESAEAAARHLGITQRNPIAVMHARGGPSRDTTLSDGGISERPIPARLVYEPLESGELVLAWLMEIEDPESPHLWSVTVDAETGELLEQEDLTNHDTWDPPVEEIEAFARRLRAAAPPARGDAGVAREREGEIVGVPGSGTYRVYGQPKADPNDGDRILVTDPADPLGSPFGWHDTDGAPGAESTLTTGNNVDAYTDINNNNNGSAPDIRPDGGAALTFDFPINFADNPIGHRPAAVANLFYWNNKIHDLSYRYGFTETAGNFQTNQYGRGPAVAPFGNNDPVRAEAQDGGGMNNANFSTGTDGNPPRMQMYLWVPQGGYRLQVTSGPIGEYIAVRGNFGAFLADSHVTQPTATVEAASPANGCAALVGFTAGNIAYLTSGGCNNVTKSVNAQAAGAAGVLINTGNDDNNLATMTGVTPVDAAGNPTLTIPALGISTNTAALLAPQLPFTAKLAFLGIPAPLRDGDFDAGVIVHEYTHGISNRLTGGRLVVNCLQGQEQMGEGWSDWIAMAFTHDPDRPDPRTRGIGPYIRFTGVNGPGIRPTPYSTDMTINPSTYDTLKSPTLAVPHGVGYVWSSMLWEVYWNLIDKHGFNADIYQPWNTGGNNLAIQLVMDGMKLQPCRPGFVTGRDAILQADTALTGGANQCLIWKGFTKRGLGAGALQGETTSRLDGVESFDLPVMCQAVASVVPSSLESTVECSASASHTVTISNPTAPDGDDLDWSITETSTTCAAPEDLSWVSASPASGSTPAEGSSDTTVTFDSNGASAGTYTGRLCVATNAGAKEVALTLNVQDTTPPVISGVSVTPTSIWPPNHEMVDVTVSYTATDTCGGNVTTALSVTSNEAVNGPGDGSTSPDWEIVGANAVRVRAERSGTGTGRIYSITITATDASGNVTTQTVPVYVPHSQ